MLFLMLAWRAAAEPPRLIPRTLLFGNPTRFSPHLAPDGKSLGWVAPDDKGVLNIWAGALDGSGAKLVTHERRPLWEYQWSGDGTRVLFPEDGDGDEVTHIFCADVAGGNVRDLTPFRGVRAQNLIVSTKKPNEILVGLDLRDRRLFDMYRINLETGAVTLEAANPGDVSSWTVDENFVIRALTAYDAEANTVVRVRDSATAPWRNLIVIPFERATIAGQLAGGSLVAGFAPGGKSLYVASTLHSNTARIERVDAATGKTLEVIAEDPNADVDTPWASSPAVITNPRTDAIEAARFDYLEPKWRFAGDAIAAEMQRIERETDGYADIVDRDTADRRWLIASHSAARPNAYFLYDRPSRTLTKLFDAKPKLLGYALAKPKPLLIAARDGMQLVSYLTLPPGSDGRDLPLIVFPHGGPWYRDDMFWFPELQFYANRGYAVLQVNYRGSTGLGIKYYNAGNGQLGRGMNEDLYDAVRWAVAQGIADPKRIAIIGGSMGGYATLRAVTTHPEMFACAVSAVGPSDVKALISSFPPYWVAATDRWKRRIGDVIHDETLNRSISPLYDAAKITMPLFVQGGGNDPRVRLEQSDWIVKAVRDAGHPVTYVVYPDEGHDVDRMENRLDFFGRLDQFLGQCLGGRFEPFVKVEGTSAEVR
jgi:dipeptidyl aminopeptidase/acylaminoacyl peptidase